MIAYRIADIYSAIHTIYATSVSNMFQQARDNGIVVACVLPM